jgi:NAD(P) transhydrogenase
MKKYDLVVIGSGPAGEKAAVKAAYFNKSVALVEKKPVYGGAGVHTGTLPSKTLKETSLYYSGIEDKGMFGVDRKFDHETSINDFMFRKNFVISSEAKEVERNLTRHKVDTYHGTASFQDSHTIRIEGKENDSIQADYFIIATGSYPVQPSNIPFEFKRVHDSDSILNIKHFPTSICVVGAGVIGCEYATIFSTMGSKVYLINHRDEILPFLDKEVSHALVNAMEKSNIEILFNNSFDTITLPENPDEKIKIHLKTGLEIYTEMFLFAAGRSGNVKDLQLDKAGVELGEREVIKVNDSYQSNVPHIYAVGDVIGFPALASTSMEQGRVAVAHIFNTGDLEHVPDVFPYGIYTIPEVSMVGITEEEAKKQGIPYCIGKARYRDMPRGKIMGCEDGFLKLIFRRDNLQILGVHILGRIATELVHYGMSIIENKKHVFNIISTVFNFPTLHDLYKYACYDGLGNLSGHKIKT